jgi:hypothetical protein
MIESNIENKVRKYAKERGWLTYKFVSPAQSGVPDRLFMKSSKLFFIEFKPPGGKLRALQAHQISKIRKEGFRVYVIDSIKEGKKLIDSYEKSDL